MVLIPKITFSEYFAVFSGNALELMVPAEPPNTHPWPQLMQKEPTVLLNLLMRGRISGVQNVTLYCKIATIIQLLRWVYKWSLAQGIYKTLYSLFLYQIELRYQALKIRLFVLGLFERISNAHSCTRSDNIKKTAP